MISRAEFEDRPTVRLTRHFFNGFFDLGFLTDDGVQSFERMLIGILAVFFSFGMLLARIFNSKYRALALLYDSAEPYRLAIQADHAFIMALPMAIVGFVTVVISHALFPDETDYRVLMPLPIRRRLIFITKLLALGIFTGLFITATHVALIAVLVRTLANRWAEHNFVAALLAFFAASAAASAFAILSVIALNGLMVLSVPRARLAGVSTLARSALVSALVLSLPLIGRLAGQSSAFGRHAIWLYFTPPAWFVGIERLLLGHVDGFTLRLAGAGILAMATALMVAVATYLILYRHFDRVLTRPVDGAAHEEGGLLPWVATSGSAGGSSLVAVRQFTTKTLRRSVLHQGIFVALSSIGLGIGFNQLLGSDFFGWLRTGGPASPGLVGSLTWTPFVLIYTFSLAVRASLVIPIEQRANWVFRMTERDAIRVDQLKAASHVMTLLGVALPIAMFLPFQWMAMGLEAAAKAAVIMTLWGTLFVEVLLGEWQRIPFTSTYIPGKKFVPQMIVVGFFSFILFTTFGYGFVTGSVGKTPFFIVITTILTVAAGIRRYLRLRRWRSTPLMFEDLPPTDIQVLGLNAG